MRKHLNRIINYFPKVSGCTTLLIFNYFTASAQLNWIRVDSLYQPLPASVHVYKTTDLIDGKPNIAYYVIADLKDKKLFFDADTTFQRRITPAQFYKKNNQPLVVVNCTFFSFTTYQNLNVVIKDGKLVGYNPQFVLGISGKDSSAKLVPNRSAIGINKKRIADIAWIKTDSVSKLLSASQLPFKPGIRTPDSFKKHDILDYDSISNYLGNEKDPYRSKDGWSWKMQTAVGGGPVILQKGKIFITNEAEMMFRGKAINDKHPRTAMGYTKDNKLIILVVQGRLPGIAEGATLGQEAKILQDLGCWEALNLDGGGSSCMLVNGKETIKPSDVTGQRAVPAVFLINRK